MAPMNENCANPVDYVIATITTRFSTLQVKLHHRYLSFSTYHVLKLLSSQALHTYTCQLFSELMSGILICPFSSFSLVKCLSIYLHAVCHVGWCNADCRLIIIILSHRVIIILFEFFHQRLQLH